MENLSFEVTPELLPVIIVAVVQMLKRIAIMETVKEWYPVIGVAIGIAISFYLKFPNPVMLGVISGCVASKSYDILKKPAAKIVESVSKSKTK